MPKTLLIMEAGSITSGTNANNVHAIDVQQMQLPGWEANYQGHIGAGSAVEIEIDTHWQKLESGFNLVGFNPDMMKLIGRWTKDAQRFSLKGAIRDRLTNTLIGSRAVVWGKLAKAMPTQFRRGDLVGHEYMIKGITHYELYLGNDRVYYFDFFENSLVIGEYDANAEMNQVLGIAGAEGASVAIGGAETAFAVA